MKFLILPLFLLATTSLTAIASDDVLAQMRLSTACENHVFSSMEAMCDKESKADESRKHPCEFWGQVNIKRDAEDTGYFEADFTVADAVVYTYGAKIVNNEKCEFKVVSRN